MKIVFFCVIFIIRLKSLLPRLVSAKPCLWGGLLSTKLPLAVLKLFAKSLLSKMWFNST